MIFFCGSVYFGQQVKKTMFIYFLIMISRGTPSDISRNPGWETLIYTHTTLRPRKTMENVEWVKLGTDFSLNLEVKNTELV
jgi:hypothetical protein